MELFAILPYLKTSGTVTIRGIDFRSSTEVDLLAPAAMQHLSTLFSMFFLQDDFRIKQMSYACFDVSDDEQNMRVRQRLMEVHHLLAYMYCSPHPTLLDPFLKREHANIYTFAPESLSQFLICPNNSNLESVSSTNPYPTPNSREEMPGYRGILNNESPLWVTQGSRIYPPSTHFWLNISQDLYTDLRSGFPSSHGGGIWSFVGTGEPRLGPIGNRIFTALKWYNRSNSIDIGDDVALLHLAIAFESLLALEQAPQITQRFKESVGLLVGPVPKLESWADQFYQARSEIVHQGNATDLLFYAAHKGNKLCAQYRSLVSLGHSIFRICLNAIVAGADTACQAGLASLLATNQERFEHICKILAKAGPDSTGALLSVRGEILDIDEYKFVREDNLKIDTILTANKLAARHFVATKPNIPSEVLDLYSRLSNVAPSPDHFEELEIVTQIANHIGAYESGPSTAPADAIGLVFSLTRSVYHYIFMQYYALKRLREKKPDIS